MYYIEWSDGSYLREYSINRFGRSIDKTDYIELAVILTKEEAEFIIQQNNNGTMKEIK